jgi:predicted nucleic acid-binding Zn ribbon protein
MHALQILNSKFQIAMRPLAQAVPGALIELLKGAPLSDGKVTCAWRAAVGPALERVTAVKLEGRVLLVDTASAQWSREIMRSSPVILKRLQGFLGAAVVERIEVRRA